jgi:hypothetical protein
MAKRKTTRAVDVILGLAQDAANFAATAKDARRAVSFHKDRIALLKREVAEADAGTRRRLKRAAHLVRALPPDELAELLSAAPAWFRTILVPTI